MFESQKWETWWTWSNLAWWGELFWLQSDIKEEQYYQGHPPIMQEEIVLQTVLWNNLQRRQLMDVFVAVCPTKSGNAQWNVLTFWIRLDCRFCRNAAFYESAPPWARFLLILFHNSEGGNFLGPLKTPGFIKIGSPKTPRWARWKYLKTKIQLRSQDCCRHKFFRKRNTFSSNWVRG